MFRKPSAMTSRPGGETRGTLVLLNTYEPILAYIYILPDCAYRGGAYGESRRGGAQWILHSTGSSEQEALPLVSV